MTRKHRKQMSTEEITFTETLVHSMSGWDLASAHAEDRMQQKNISKDAVVNTLKYGDVIEVADNGRVTLRLMKGMKKGTCAVVSLKDRIVVTVWYNNGSDNHKTLNLGDYTLKTNVVNYLRSIQ